MNIEMNQYQVEAHFELAQSILNQLKTLIPQEKLEFGRAHSLSKLYLDEDGVLTAEYSRYMGCGETSTLTEHPSLSQILG